MRTRVQGTKNIHASSPAMRLQNFWHIITHSKEETAKEKDNQNSLLLSYNANVNDDHH
jgi:hypothetical protein